VTTKTVIPTSKIVKIMKENGIERVSKDTAKYLSEILEEYLLKITKEANELCKYAKRKTISVEDMQTVVKKTE
jgi:histone H3/H4